MACTDQHGWPAPAWHPQARRREPWGSSSQAQGMRGSSVAGCPGAQHLGACCGLEHRPPLLAPLLAHPALFKLNG